MESEKNYVPYMWYNFINEIIPLSMHYGVFEEREHILRRVDDNVRNPKNYIYTISPELRELLEGPLDIFKSRKRYKITFTQLYKFVHAKRYDASFALEYVLTLCYMSRMTMYNSVRVHHFRHGDFSLDIIWDVDHLISNNKDKTEQEKNPSIFDIVIQTISRLKHKLLNTIKL